MKTKLRWGIIGTGPIARKFAEGLIQSETGELAAVGSRSLQSAQAFTHEFPAPSAPSITPYGSYEALLADPAVQAVYIALPHPYHAEWAIKSAEAGKAVLCEKPFTMTAREAEAAVDAARRHHVFLMEAFMYRCHPQTARLVELIRAKAIGDVRFIRANFSFRSPLNPQSRLFNRELGGGGILDVGCYCVSMARLVAGAAIGEAFQNPIETMAVGQIGETGVDEFAIASLKFPGGILAQLAAGLRVTLDNHVTIVGTEGSLELANPWAFANEGGLFKICLSNQNGLEEIELQTDRSSYAFEADHVAQQLALGLQQSPLVSWNDTLGNMQVIDQWRRQITAL